MSYSESFPSLEQQSGWIQPGNVGNDGGASALAHGSYGSVLGTNGYTVFITPAKAYDNYYLYKPLGAHTQATKFTYTVELSFPDPVAGLAACQALEFEIQQNYGGHIYNGAWQINFAGDQFGFTQWRYFNYTASQWVNSGIQVNRALFTAGKPVTIVAVYQRNPDQTMTHLTLSINGTVYPVGIVQPATPRVESDYLNVAVQLDANSTAKAYGATFKASLALA